jgi:hypothetical protein
MSNKIVKLQKIISLGSVCYDLSYTCLFVCSTSGEVIAVLLRVHLLIINIIKCCMETQVGL